MPDEDENFSFRKSWRHVKMIYPCSVVKLGKRKQFIFLNSQ